MNTVQCCPECKAVWSDGLTCQDHFYQMLIWENETSSFGAQVHHLAVLCYYLQHPGLYSPEGLTGAMRLLTDFLERGMTPQDTRWRDRRVVDSSTRKFKIKGTPAAHGEYHRHIVWTMTAADVTAAGAKRYVERVKAWAQSILDALKVSGNLLAN